MVKQELGEMTLAGRKSTSTKAGSLPGRLCFLCEKRASADEFSAAQLQEPACSLNRTTAL